MATQVRCPEFTGFPRSNNLHVNLFTIVNRNPDYVQFSSDQIVFGLDFFGYYFISSIIIFKVQIRSWFKVQMHGMVELMFVTGAWPPKRPGPASDRDNVTRQTLRAGIMATGGSLVHLHRPLPYHTIPCVRIRSVLVVLYLPSVLMGLRWGFLLRLGLLADRFAFRVWCVGQGARSVQLCSQ